MHEEYTNFARRNTKYELARTEYIIRPSGVVLLLHEIILPDGILHSVWGNLVKLGIECRNLHVVVRGKSKQGACPCALSLFVPIASFIDIQTTFPTTASSQVYAALRERAATGRFLYF